MVQLAAGGCTGLKDPAKCKQNRRPAGDKVTLQPVPANLEQNIAGCEPGHHWQEADGDICEAIDFINY